MKPISNIPGKLARIKLYGEYGDAFHGAAKVKLRSGFVANVILSAEAGWEHVSVALDNRCPTWRDMCEIKDLFFDHDEAVVQFHPARESYVNIHPNCLHLWRPIEADLPMPPTWMV